MDQPAIQELPKKKKLFFLYELVIILKPYILSELKMLGMSVVETFKFTSEMCRGL